MHENRTRDIASSNFNRLARLCERENNHCVPCRSITRSIILHITIIGSRFLRAPSIPINWLVISPFIAITWTWTRTRTFSALHPTYLTLDFFGIDIPDFIHVYRFLSVCHSLESGEESFLVLKTTHQKELPHHNTFSNQLRYSLYNRDPAGPPYRRGWDI